MVVVGSSVVVVVVVVVVGLFTTSLLATLLLPSNSDGSTIVSATSITYPAGASISLTMYLVFSNPVTLMSPFASVSYSPTTCFVASRITWNLAPFKGFPLSSVL